MGYYYKYKIETPIIAKMRQKYEEMVLFDDINSICDKFGIDEKQLIRILYSDSKCVQGQLLFDTIIRLSHMFDIPVTEFIEHNAYVNFYKNKKNLEEEEEVLKQYEVGKSWEDEVINYYSKRNYFVYKIPTLNSGTVFDIIVVKNGAALMIECKHIESDKLYYASSGLLKKTDEIEHFINTTGNNVYIYVKSDKTGTFWTTWEKSKNILKERGYITKEDCFPCVMNPEERNEDNENNN